MSDEGWVVMPRVGMASEHSALFRRNCCHCTWSSLISPHKERSKHDLSPFRDSVALFRRHRCYETHLTKRHKGNTSQYDLQFITIISCVIRHCSLRIVTRNPRGATSCFRRHQSHTMWTSTMEKSNKTATAQGTQRNKNQVDVLFKGIRSAAKMHKNLKYFPPRPLRSICLLLSCFSGSDNVHSSSDGSRF